MAVRSRSVDKPPYRVPTMAEVEAVPDIGLRVVSTFSGAGGSCLGYRMAGLRVLWANEFIPAAVDTYRRNHPGPVDVRDIREVTGDDIRQVVGDAEIDVFDGSPPCTSFSMAGARERNWGLVKKHSDTKQRSDDLFFEYTRLLKDLQPRAFVAENVAGLIRGTAKGYFKEIFAELVACGYQVRAKVLDAQWLGVPQARQRLIFLGIRDDLGLAPAFPRPLPYRYSVREALGWSVEHALVGGRNGRLAGQRLSVDTPAPTVMAGGIAGVGNTQLLVNVSTGWLKGKQVSAGDPFPTVTAHGVAGANPGDIRVPTDSGTRKFTIDELKALCSFPADFELTGNFVQQWERLGNSVPPLMMRAVAGAVRDTLLKAEGAGHG